MKNDNKKSWFQDSILINCKIKIVNNSLNNLGEHFKKVISEMPGMTTVDQLNSVLEIWFLHPTISIRHLCVFE